MFVIKPMSAVRILAINPAATPIIKDINEIKRVLLLNLNYASHLTQW